MCINIQWGFICCVHEGTWSQSELPGGLLGPRARFWNEALHRYYLCEFLLHGILCIELSLPNCIFISNACIHQAFYYSDVSTCLRIGCFRSRVYFNSGSLKQGVWGCSPSEALGYLVFDLSKIQDSECISQVIWLYTYLVIR